MSDEQKEQQAAAPEPQVKMRNGRSPLANANAQTALLRGLEVLQEGDTNEESEGTLSHNIFYIPVLEIRKLDSQLDHLNDYMSKMEARLQAHNERLMETLKQQKEEREKRRRSFHEVSRDVLRKK